MAERQASMRFVGRASVAVLVQEVTRHHADNPPRPEAASGERGACLDAFGVGKHRRARATCEREHFEEMDIGSLDPGRDKRIRRIAGENPST